MDLLVIIHVRNRFSILHYFTHITYTQCLVPAHSEQSISIHAGLDLIVPTALSHLIKGRHEDVFICAVPHLSHKLNITKVKRVSKYFPITTKIPDQ